MNVPFTCAVVLAAGGLAAAQGWPPPQAPSGNLYTTAKARLGKVLFWDEQLSSTRTVACGTCHSQAGADPRSLDAVSTGAIHPSADGVYGTDDDVRGSPGVIASDASGRYVLTEEFRLVPRVTRRKAPSVINAAYNSWQFWDGRAGGSFTDPLTGNTTIMYGASLESQALEPLLNSTEMGHEGRTWQDVTDRIKSVRPLAIATDIGKVLETWIDGRGYPGLFFEAFGTPDITPTRIAFAIAHYERTLVADMTPLDLHVYGDPGALTADQKQGFHIFNFKGRCDTCHSVVTPGFTPFLNTGVRPSEEDLGRGAISSAWYYQGAFKVPGLRNVGLRAPYFHNGGFDTLEEVVEFYDRGGDFHEDQSSQIQPLGLTATEKTQLVDFLRNGLTDPRVVAETWPFDRPRLFTESERAPRLLPPATAGTGSTPRMVMVEPAVLGNDSMTVAVVDGFGGFPAVLAVGLVQADKVVNGVHMHVAPAGLVTFLSAGNLEGVGYGTGYACMTRRIPDDPALAGHTLFAQWFTGDPYANGGMAASEGVRFEIFAPLETP